MILIQLFLGFIAFIACFALVFGALIYLRKAVK